MENAGLRRYEASCHIFSRGRAISRHRKQVGLEVADRFTFCLVIASKSVMWWSEELGELKKEASITGTHL